MFGLLDLEENRLKMAKKLGANATLLVRKEDTEAEAVRRVFEAMGEEPDKTIDACGAESSIRLAILVSLPTRSYIFFPFLSIDFQSVPMVGI